jgi:uncharacterized membrane protein YGL010W
MALMSDRSWSDWISAYGESHQHPVNRLCHSFGIPMITVAMVLFVAGLVAHVLWIPAGALFVAGWILQLVGHAFEGKPPEFLKDWRFMLVGLRWWAAKLRGKA